MCHERSKGEGIKHMQNNQKMYKEREGDRTARNKYHMSKGNEVINIKIRMQVFKY